MVIDGGGRVTLDGRGRARILYMNTCDPGLVWTTSHCQDQDHPTLTVQNITFRNGRSSGERDDGGGGARSSCAAAASRWSTRASTRTDCAPTGPDVGGGAIQVFSPVRRAPGLRREHDVRWRPARCGNDARTAARISSIGVSWTILNSLFPDNRAIGTGANPAAPGTPGGGNGGAIYNDGNDMTLRLDGTRIEGNRSNGEGGSAIFFVSNDRTGFVDVVDSVIRNNTGDGFETYPSIFFIGRRITFTNSTVE